MTISNYIFLTNEGHTYQPNMGDIENSQLIGIAKGKNSYNAFQNLLKENPYILKTSFNKVFCYKLTDDFEKEISFFEVIKHRRDFHNL